MQCMYTTLVVDIITYTDYGRRYVMRPLLLHSGATVKFGYILCLRVCRG
jgi:hypothetical protein